MHVLVSRFKRKYIRASLMTFRMRVIVKSHCALIMTHALSSRIDRAIQHVINVY